MLEETQAVKSSRFNFSLYFFMCMSVLLSCVYVYHMSVCAHGGEKRHRIP